VQDGYETTATSLSYLQHTFQLANMNSCGPVVVLDDECFPKRHKNWAQEVQSSFVSSWWRALLTPTQSFRKLLVTILNYALKHFGDADGGR
jgi:hypothetical protein